MAPTTTVFVKLLNEDIDVWRPVAAEHLRGDLYRLLEDPPEGEVWPFGKNDLVVCHRQLGSEPQRGAMLVAREKLSTEQS